MYPILRMETAVSNHVKSLLYAGDFSFLGLISE